MKIKKLILGGAFLASLAPAVGNADPVKHGNCGIKIKQPKMSSGFYFSDDCKTAYVLPPRLGSMTIGNYGASIDTNLVCEAIHHTESANTDMAATNASFAKIIRLKSKRLVELEKGYETGEFPDGMSEDEALAEIIKIRDFIKDSRETFTAEYNSYLKRKGDYAIMEGGLGTFYVENQYTELMNEFYDKNKNVNIYFERMPLKQSFISVVDKTFNSHESSAEMKTVKRMSIPGIGKMPLMETVATINSKELLNSADNSPNPNVDIFGDAISGEIELSALGACAVNEELGGVSSFNADEVKGKMSANAFYEYEVQVERSYYVSYNLSELIHIIRESSKRGGFFSRRTVNRLIETRESDSWIKFHSKSNDTSYEYSPEDIKKIKADFIDRALRQVIAIKGDGKVSPLVLLDPSGKNGAQTIGDELAKCPHLYCQIGAAGFKILGSIFGSEKATSEIMKKLNVNAKEEAKETKMVKFVGSMTFK